MRQKWKNGNSITWYYGRNIKLWFLKIDISFLSQYLRAHTHTHTPSNTHKHTHTHPHTHPHTHTIKHTHKHTHHQTHTPINFISFPVTMSLSNFSGTRGSDGSELGTVNASNNSSSASICESPSSHSCSAPTTRPNSSSALSAMPDNQTVSAFIFVLNICFSRPYILYWVRISFSLCRFVIIFLQELFH